MALNPVDQHKGAIVRPARNASNKYDSGDPLGQDISGGGAPSAIGDLAISSIGSSTASLSWSAIGDADNIEVYRRDVTASGAFTLVTPLAGGASSYNDSGLTPENQYEWRLTAVNANGSTNSNIASGTTTSAVVGDITDLSTSNITSESVRLSWTPNGEVLDVERALSGGAFSTVQTGISGTTNEATVGSLTPETAYDFRLSWNGGTSNVASATTVAAYTGDGALPASFSIASEGNPLTFINCHEDLNCNPRAIHRNAYPGLEWDYILGAQGGKWPYYWTIMDGPTGLTIGSFLVPDGSGTGRLIPGADYERLQWQNPVAGNHTITVRCTDQLGNFIERTWTLVVGTANHAFIDAVNGSNSTGDGTINNPWANDLPLHSGSYLTNTYQDYTVWVRGEFLLAGMTDANNNLRIGSGCPHVFRRWPGYNPIINLRNQKIVMFGGPGDMAIHGIEINHDTTGWTDSDRHIFQLLNGFNRAEITDFRSQNYTTGPTGGNNPAVLYASGATRRDVMLKNWDITGNTGTIFNTYWLDNFLMERIRVHDCHLANNDSSSNAQALRLKQNNINGTIRGCEVWENVSYTGIQSAIGLHGSVDALNALDYCYNKVWHPETPVDGGRHGGWFQWSHTNDNPMTNIHCYRNTASSVHWEGDNNSGIQSEYWDNNIVIDGGITSDPRVTLRDNLTNGSYVDANFNLTSGFSQYRGTHGAEVFEGA